MHLPLLCHTRASPRRFHPTHLQNQDSLWPRPLQDLHSVPSACSMCAQRRARNGRDEFQTHARALRGADWVDYACDGVSIPRHVPPKVGTKVDSPPTRSGLSHFDRFSSGQDGVMVGVGSRSAPNRRGPQRDSPARQMGDTSAGCMCGF